MAFTEKTIKLLWAAAGGRCSFSGCWERLCIHDAEESSPYTLGEMAHIKGKKLGSARHDASQTNKERDDYLNLILLCPTHHTLIDRKENISQFPVDFLLDVKSKHESRVLELLGHHEITNKLNLAKTILPLLEENRQSWSQYGPLSKLARTSPNDDKAYAVWRSERLSIIIPNNRKINKLLTSRKNLFDVSEQVHVSKFRMHVRSYELWVNDKISYDAVKRFPVDFENLIRGTVNAGT